MSDISRKGTLYEKVYDYLRDKIKNEYKPEDILPPQSKIAEDTQTSLITVKRAIKELEAEGYLVSKAGKGTIVKSKPVIDNHVGISSWTDSITDQGGIPQTAWTKIQKRTPIDKIASKLMLKAREKTVLISRLRSIDDKPICLMTNELPANLVPGIEKEALNTESLYALLKDRFQLIPLAADEEVKAREATPKERKLLGMKSKFVLVVDRISYLANDVPMEISSIVAPADSYIYRSKQLNKTMDSEVLKTLIKKYN